MQCCMLKKKPYRVDSKCRLVLEFRGEGEEATLINLKIERSRKSRLKECLKPAETGTESQQRTLTHPWAQSAKVLICCVLVCALSSDSEETCVCVCQSK